MFVYILRVSLEKEGKGICTVFVAVMFLFVSWFGKKCIFLPNQTKIKQNKGTAKTTTKVSTNTFTFHLNLPSLMSPSFL